MKPHRWFDVIIEAMEWWPIDLSQPMFDPDNEDQVWDGVALSCEREWMS